MTVLVLCALSVLLLSNQVEAKCTRATHVTEKPDPADPAKTIRNYTCTVKGNEQGNFNDNYCKNCGCHTSDHDNT